MSPHISPRKFMRLLWRVGPTNSKLAEQLKLAKVGSVRDRHDAPRKFVKWGIRVHGSKSRRSQPRQPKMDEAEKKKTAEARAAEAAEQCEMMSSVVSEEGLLEYVNQTEGLARAKRRREALEAELKRLRREALSECPVCFGSLQEHYLLPCSTNQSPHAFCQACMVTLEGMNDKRCPLCRQRYSTIDREKTIHKC
jgi:hypothetical protein